MRKFTAEELAYLESVTWHDARQSEDGGQRKLAATVNRKLQAMQKHLAPCPPLRKKKDQP